MNHGTETRTLLVVDDNDELREMAVEVLEAHGYRVLAAARGERALERVSEHPERIDLLISDVFMPGMTGLELADRLLAEPDPPEVLLVSSRPHDETLAARLAQGDLAFLRKPYSMDALIETVGALLGAGAPASSAPRDRVTAGASAREPEGEMGRAAGDGQRRLKLGGPGLVLGAALLILALGAASRRIDLTAPPLPSEVPRTVLRGTRLEATAPVGTVARLPGSFSWGPAEGAVRYDLTLRRVDGTVLWQTFVSEPRAVLPVEVRAGLHAHVAYEWTVRALDASSRTMARSATVRFVATAR